MLFFDDKNILSRYGLERKYGTPTLVSTYEDSADKKSNPLPSVWFNKKTGVYHMYYNGYINGKHGALLAISKDGVNFTRHPACNEKPLIEGVGEIACVYEDNTAPESERLKALCVYGDSNTTRIINDPLYVSADGIEWKKTAVQWHNHAAEPAAFCFYNHVTKKHTITCRPDAGVRRVCEIETDDFKTFTDAKLVMTPDSCDPPLCEHYGMPVFKCDDIFIGFLWKYEVPNIRSRKYWGGTLNAELVYSYNGTSFNRSLRHNFFDGSKFKMIQPCSLYRTPDNRVMVAAGISEKEHGYFKESGGIGIYELRQDGFISLHAKNEGEFITIPMLYQGGDITVNANAGKLTCALYTDDSKQKPMNLLTHELISLDGFTHDLFNTFSGDSIEYKLNWKNSDLNSLTGKIIYLEFKITEGELFGVNGNLIPMMICDLARYHLHGIIPDIKGIG